MKRSMEDVAGVRARESYGRDVAGAPVARPSREVASFRHALDDPMGTAETDADLMAEFAEFMDGDKAFDRGELPEPDSGFRERLRRRLWRTHVLANLRDGGETH
ncbi:MAG: hypothetical protein AAGC67_16220 [Myxococcota bacterium]